MTSEFLWCGIIKVDLILFHIGLAGRYWSVTRLNKFEERGKWLMKKSLDEKIAPRPPSIHNIYYPLSCGHTADIQMSVFAVCSFAREAS